MQPDLVAVDAEAPLQHAVTLAISQARRDRRPLVFVHALNGADEQRDDRNPPSIEAALDSATRNGVTAESRIIRGDPREAIVRTALDVDARFVFVGKSGFSNIARWFLGSVAADVVRHCERPVVVVPPAVHPPSEDVPLLSRVLVPIDPEQSETSAAASAVALGAGDSREIVFCSVVDENGIARAISQSEGANIGVDVFTGILADVRSRARLAIAAAIELAHARSAVSRGSFITGEPVGCILELADQMQATAIVMGTHGRQGLSRIFLGSTTQRVLEASKIPVMTLLLGHGLLPLDVATPAPVSAKTLCR